MKLWDILCRRSRIIRDFLISKNKFQVKFIHTISYLEIGRKQELLNCEVIHEENLIKVLSRMSSPVIKNSLFLRII